MNKQLRMGIEAEREHTKTITLIKKFVKKHGKFPSNDYIFMNIAKNHLEEDKNYYTKLERMERKK